MAHKIALWPTKEQEIYLQKAIGTARFAYNWGLTEWACQYNLAKEDEDSPSPNWMDLNARLNAIKVEDSHVHKWISPGWQKSPNMPQSTA